MKTLLLKTLLLAVLFPVTALAQQDSLLDHMAGNWVLNGTIGGSETTHDISTEWVLGHQYIQIKEVSREMDSNGKPSYEAIVFISFDQSLKEYACLWLDNTGNTGLSGQAIGHARENGSTIEFIFKISESNKFHTIFAYEKDTDCWRWSMDDEQNGKFQSFARVKLTRLSKRTNNPQLPNLAKDGGNITDQGKVTGIGGIFFKCKDPDKLKDWYKTHLGLNTDKYGANFEWREGADSSKYGITQWSPFSYSTKYFAPSEKDFMINYRVKNLDRLVEDLKKGGVTILDKIEVSEYGKFIHIIDIEGNKIELWEPVVVEYNKIAGERTK